MEEFKHINQFDKRQTGQFSAKEETEFQTRIQSDEGFAGEFELFEEILEAVKLTEEDALRDRMKGIQTKMKTAAKKKVNKTIKFRPWWGIAASFLLLFSLFGYANIYFSNQALSNLKSQKLLFDTNGTRSSDLTADPFNEGQIAIEKGDFQGAIAFFERILKDDPDYAVAQFRLAYAQFQYGQREKTLNTLQNLSKQQNLSENLQEDIDWLELQTLLALNKMDGRQAQQLLTKITLNKNHNYHTEAKKISVKINRFWRKLVI